MKDIILDLRDLEMPNETRELFTPIGDHPAMQAMENMLLDNAGKLIRVKVSQVRPRKPRKPAEDAKYGGFHICNGTLLKPHIIITVTNGERCKLCGRG
jgi:hypothetical protein